MIETCSTAANVTSASMHDDVWHVVRDIMSERSHGARVPVRFDKSDGAHTEPIRRQQ